MPQLPAFFCVPKSIFSQEVDEDLGLPSSNTKAVGRSENLEGGLSNVVGIICPHSKSKSGSAVPLPGPLGSDSPEHLAGVISLNSERSIKLIIKKLYTNWARALTIDPNLVESLPKDSHNGYPTVFTPLFVTLRVAGHCFCQIGMLKKDSPNQLNTYWQYPKSFFVGFP